MDLKKKQLLAKELSKVEGEMAELNKELKELKDLDQPEGVNAVATLSVVLSNFENAGGTLVLSVTPAESAVAASVELSDETEAELGNDGTTSVSHSFALLTTECRVTIAAAVGNDEAAPPPLYEVAVPAVDSSTAGSFKVAGADQEAGDVKVKVETRPSASALIETKKAQVNGLVKKRKDLRQEVQQIAQQEESERAAQTSALAAAKSSPEMLAQATASRAMQKWRRVFENSMLIFRSLWSVKNLFLFAGGVWVLHYHGDDLAV